MSSKKTKTALITGISGMVGSHLAEYLMSHTDWSIHGLIRWRSPLENLENIIPYVNNQQRVYFHYGDLRDAQSINKVVKEVKPDYVFHLAAQSYPLTSFDAPIDTYETNISGTSILLESIKNNCKESIVHVCASSEVFGRVPKDKLPINEECNFHPASPYAISKIGTDLVGRFYAEAYNMKVMTTRMFTHTGPRRGDVFAESTFAKQIALAEANIIDPVIKVGNLESMRTIADVRDAVRAYYLLVTKNPIGGEYYNIGGSYSCKIKDILDDLISLSTIKDQIKVKEDPNRLRPIDADLQVPDTTKFTNHTGWKPEIPYKETILDLLNYWRNKVSKNNGGFLTR
jgi:GDP-4-dehydro-6-deoxy-D-mannose reductase|tara:strand:- start:44 stop:1072 length:1029 start_codon:yes stop_codon:yes gene_type:complete